MSSSSTFGSSRSAGGGDGRRQQRSNLPPRPFSASFFPGAHKTQLESAIVRRRQLESEKEQYWSTTRNYYDSVGRNADRFNHWNSDAVVQTSLEASYKEQQLETRRSDLARRREKLRTMLSKESAALKEELRLLPPSWSSSSSTDLASLRGAREAMRRQREEEQKKEAEEKMLQHWKLNNPEFRELQFKKHRDLVQKAWEIQQQEKDVQREAEKKAEMRRMQVEIEENVKQEFLKKMEEEKKEKKLSEWKETIMRQIDELRSKKLVENVLKEEIRVELELLAKTEEVSSMKKKMEQRRKNMEMGHYLQRQHALKLRVRAAQVQRELEDDRKIVEEMQKISQDRPRVEKQLRELEWMNKVLTEQKEEENRREKQMNFLFSEEAEGFWDRQEQVWNAEKVAREKLMDNVVIGWKTQIEQRINASQEKVAKIAEERLKIQAEMERVNREIESEDKAKLEKRDMFVQDIQEQIEEKKKRLPEDGKKEEEGGGQLTKTNELAAKLAQWDLQSELLVSDFRRRRAKWF